MKQLRSSTPSPAPRAAPAPQQAAPAPTPDVGLDGGGAAGSATPVLDAADGELGTSDWEFEANEVPAATLASIDDQTASWSADLGEIDAALLPAMAELGALADTGLRQGDKASFEEAWSGTRDTIRAAGEIVEDAERIEEDCDEVAEGGADVSRLRAMVTTGLAAVFDKSLRQPAFAQAWVPTSYDGGSSPQGLTPGKLGVHPKFSKSPRKVLSQWERYAQDSYSAYSWTLSDVEAVERFAAAAMEYPTWVALEQRLSQLDGFGDQPEPAAIDEFVSPFGGVVPPHEDAVGRSREYLDAVFAGHTNAFWSGMAAQNYTKTVDQIYLEDQTTGQVLPEFENLETAISGIRKEVESSYLSDANVLTWLAWADTPEERDYVLFRLEHMSLLSPMRNRLSEDAQKKYDDYRSKSLSFKGGRGEITEGPSLVDCAVDVVEGYADAIASLADLDAILATLGQTEAVELLLEIAGDRLSLVLDWLIDNPASQFLAPVIKLIGDAVHVLAEILDRITVDDVVLVAKRIAGIGLLAVLCAALWLLETVKLVPVLGDLGEQLLLAVWRHLPADFKALITELFTEVWPEGYGLAFDANLGATFGIPIHVGVDAYLRVAHTKAGQFQMQRGGTLKVGLDTGAGVGFSAGVPGKKKKGISEGDDVIAAEAGASAGAGLKTVAHEEYDFPVTEDEAFLSLVTALLQGFAAGPGGMVKVLNGSTGKIDPDAYLSKTKTELKAYAEADAQANIGLHTANASTREGKETWKNNEVRKSTVDKKKGWWTHLLSTTAGIQGHLSGEAGGGIELGKIKRDQGKVTSAELSIYGEASAVASVGSTLPLPLPALGVDRGFGVKLTTTVTGDPAAEKATWSKPKISAYTKSGDLDRYAGAASETEVELIDFEKASFDSLDDLVSNIGAMTYTKRFGIEGVAGGKFKRHLNKIDVLRGGATQKGLVYNASVDLKSDIPAKDVKKMIAALKSIIKNPDGLSKVKDDLMTLVSTGSLPPGLTADASVIAEVVLANVEELKLHAEVGVGAAGSGSAGAGAKVRLDVGGAAKILYEKDLKEEIKLQAGEVKELLTGVTS